ncbi:hypothetical protein K450DRAFT_252634 [Umbelopsis ramanniana AG]|uniref:Uncharacterized protein n=1 Tax=Umbelopsis ramanniana AG TaxID=1314678 RepID=A0AAD5E4N7_UMBRA|nr:uncharacterized protein K450DRAFT_252634 [Umbelopsis ramanniana AG]KAI8577326.1 hypothetical protein K450DRAFT_252634 [Umbelopsis ramanniana AG]
MEIKPCYFLVAIATLMIIVCGSDIDNQLSYAFCNKCIATNICFFFMTPCTASHVLRLQPCIV